MLLVRYRQDELMDDPALDPAIHAEALVGLARLNTLSGAAPILFNAIKKFAARTKRQSLRILDIATGSADVPLSLWQLGQRSGLQLQIDGCDVSETAVRYAAKRAEAYGAPSKFFKCDAKLDCLPSGYDIIVNSLFFHHLSESETVELLRNMADATGSLVLVSDLERSLLNLAMVSFATRLVSNSYVVHFDGPASVRNAYTAEELRHLASRAGLSDAQVTSRFPCRMLLSWERRS